MKLVMVDEVWAAALRIPKGKSDTKVEPPLGGTSAAAGDGADADDAEARNDEAVAPLAVMLSCDTQLRPMRGSCGVPHDAAPRVLVANADPSACCAGLAKSERWGCVRERGAA